MTTLSPDQRGAAFMVLAMAAFAVEDVLFKQATTDTQIGVALLIVGLGGFVIFALMSLRAGEAVWHPAIVSRALVLRTVFELAGRLGYG
ncbi:MAG: EamA/RhaT family transporter, partial [Proteobacteria bacterium]|nr:EamA/RhaT family transporter [Pseudomonadota bacterium]